MTPCLLWVLKTLNLALCLSTPRVIPWCLALKGGNINVYSHLKYYTLIRQQEIKYRHDINISLYWSRTAWISINSSSNHSWFTFNLAKYNHLQISTVIILCIFPFLFIGREPTTWPANNCLQIMVCPCVVPTKCVLALIMFFFVLETTSLHE